jgi:hypothetical protein
LAALVLNAELAAARVLDDLTGAVDRKANI